MKVIIRALLLVLILCVCLTGCLSKEPMVYVSDRFSDRFDKIENRLRVNEWDINFYTGIEREIANRLTSIEERVELIEKEIGRQKGSNPETVKIRIVIDTESAGGSSSFNSIQDAIDYLEEFR